MMAITREQRHTKANRCPVCGGADGDPRDKGKRCNGFTSADGEWCHCSREERAGAIVPNDAGLFAHKMHGDCNCGTSHGEASGVYPSRAQSMIEATYDYTDEGGRLLFQVIRKLGKGFLQRAADGAGGWVYKIAGVRRVPYHLSAVLAAPPDRPIHWVEGEKDVESLERIGLVATTSAQGAKSFKHTAAEAKKALAGRPVIVIADADDPGRIYAREVAAALDGVASSVSTHECRAPYKDVSDLLAEGGTFDDLIALQAPPQATPPAMSGAARDERSEESMPKEPKAPPTVDRRRVIQHQESSLSPSVYGSIAALAESRSVYVTGDRLVQVSCATAKDAERSAWTDSQGRTRYAVHAGSPRVTPISPAVLKLRISEAVRFEKYVRTRAAWEPCAPPDDVVRAAHELRSWDLPQLVGIAETPILRPDGTIASKRGYDPSTAYWIAPSEHFEGIAAEPTKDDAVRAYAALTEVFADFPFASSGQSAVPIAVVLTVLARAYLAHGSVPGVVCDAGAGGVGKTLLTDAIATITTGRPASRKAYPATDEECEKVLAAYALRGASFISIDDVKRPLGGENLDRVATARGEVDFRRLGKTELLTLPWRAVMAFTGVNVRFLGQMARRMLIARIESRLERPQDRADFKHPELLAWITEHRARLVVAALTVLRAYIVKGSPDAGCKRWGSFEEWSRLIPHAIVFAGGPDVLTFRAPDDDEDMVEDVSSLRDVLAGLEKLCVERAPHHNRQPADGLTSGEIVADLFKRPSEDHAPLCAALRALAGIKVAIDPTSALVGVHLAKLKGRCLRVTDETHPAGRLLRLVKVPDKHKAGADRWAVEHVIPIPDPRGGYAE